MVDTIGIDLSQEEVLYLMLQFKIPGLPGLRLPIMDPTSSESLKTAYAAAEHSLQARNIIEKQFDPIEKVYRIIADKAAVALVGGGAFLNRALFIGYKETAITEVVTWIYFTPSLTIMHTTPEVGVHRFVALPDGASVVAVINLALHLRNDSLDLPASESAALSLKDFQQLRPEIRQKNLASVQAFLVERGYSSEFAVPFAAVWSNPTSICQITYVETDQENSHSFEVLESGAGYWMLIPEGDAVQIYPVQVTDITQRIVDLITAPSQPENV